MMQSIYDEPKRHDMTYGAEEMQRKKKLAKKGKWGYTPTKTYKAKKAASQTGTTIGIVAKGAVGFGKKLAPKGREAAKWAAPRALKAFKKARKYANKKYGDSYSL